MYDDCVIYGPYLHSDGNRLQVLIYYPDGSKKTVAYARLVYELYHGVYLEGDQHVHHIDGNSMNDSIDNLVVLNTSTHLALHQQKYPDIIECICPVCSKEFTITGKQYSGVVRNSKRKNKQGMIGPVCSRRCAGI